MYNQEGDDSEPEWVTTEREQFTQFRDKNKDGKMDKDETRDWILPEDYDHAEAEAKHLVYEADADKVLMLKLQISRFSLLIRFFGGVLCVNKQEGVILIISFNVMASQFLYCH